MHGMRPLGALLGVEEALSRLLAAAHPVAREEDVPLREARGRVASRDVVAPFDVPPFGRATMDGYALRAADGMSPRRIVGEIPAGATALPFVGPGEAARIATGAPVPPGADAVLKVELTHETEGRVSVTMAPAPGHSIDAAGTDLARGASVVSRGALLSSARLGLLASVGHDRVHVLARPRVALFSSGDELLAPGSPPDPLRIYDSNTTMLETLFASTGAQVRVGGALPDTREAMEDALARGAAEADLVVTCGGASVGARDHAAAALAATGETLFHGVRVKPGKPLLAGRVGDALVVGLPGNPASAFCLANLFLMPVLRKLAGLAPAQARTLPARLAVEVRGETDRFLVLPVRLADGVAHPTFKGSGSLTSIAGSDGWIGLREGQTLPAGALAEVTPWQETYIGATG